MAKAKQYGYEFLCILLVLLWGHAAISKWMDPYYILQLKGSPVYGEYANLLYYLIPTIELATAIIICMRRFRRLGLLISFSLLTLFTIYVSYVLQMNAPPCGCGGLISGMSWGQHLIFNILFLSVNILALFLSRQSEPMLFSELIDDLSRHKKGEAENLSE